MFSNKTHTWVKTPNKVPFDHIKPYTLRVPQDNEWKSRKRRLLVIIEHIDTNDLKEKALLGGPSEVLIDNLLTYSHQLAKQFDPDIPSLRAWGITAVNFNYFKTYDLDYKNYTISLRAAASRMSDIIDSLDPTHILVYGDDAARAIAKEVDMMLFKRGHVLVDLVGRRLHARRAGVEDAL